MADDRAELGRGLREMLSSNGNSMEARVFGPPDSLLAWVRPLELATDDELADCFDDTLRSYEWYLDSGYELFSYDEVNALGRKALEAEWYRRRQQRLGVAAG